MRPHVVRLLISSLRQSGWPGYEEDGINNAAAVERRIQELYVKPYQGANKFMPKKIEAAIEKAQSAKLLGPSLISEKTASPAEPASSIQKLEEGLRPLQIVAEKSCFSQSEAHANHANVLARYSTVELQMSSTMQEQHHPQYLGMTFPFVMPIAAGGYDLHNQEPWRRPSWEDLQAFPRAAFAVMADQADLWPCCESSDF